VTKSKQDQEGTRSANKIFMSQLELPVGRLKAREKLHTGAHTILSHHPFGTGFGSTVGAALVSVAAEAAGAGTISIFTCAATGVVVGGWAGLAISRRRLKRTDADVLRRRTRTIRLLKVARMLRRRNVA
jgi:Na+/glutamate symporter